MEAIGNLYRQFEDWLSQPFKRDMPIFQILLIFVLFVIVAYVVWDGLKLIKDFSEQAVEAAAEAVSG